MNVLDPWDTWGKFQSFVHPEDAYKKAEEAANKGYGESQGYERPFMQNGLDQYGGLNDATKQLMDPAALQSKWASGYENSPYAKQMLAQNQASGMDAASQMGLTGSSAALGNIQQGAGNIVQKDRQQYLDDLMKKYMTGIGLGTHMYETGATAGNQMAGRAMQHGNDVAGLKYGAAAAPGKLFGQVAGTVLNAYMPGTGVGNGLTGQNSGQANSFNSSNNGWLQ